MGLTLAEAAALIRDRQLSPVDLVEACIARSEALDPSLHAYLTPTFETARQEAQVAEDEIAAGRSLGPLHGIPIGLKDLYQTAGIRTTAGSPLRDSLVPAVDAEVVQRLREAGAVFMGKLNMHEWALGATNVNAHYPSPRNPWDLSRITGGSSGGSAVAVATGMCLASLGSDTGGSIRIPAALCGVTGLKPTYGRVSLRGVVPLSWSLDHAGPMAGTARDCALTLQAIAGHDPLDPGSVDVPVADYAAALSPGLAGMRIGVVRSYFFDDDAVAPEVRAAVEASIAVLRGLGAGVDEVALPGAAEAGRANGAMLVADAAAYHEERLQESPQAFGPSVLPRLLSGAASPATAYATARRQQQAFQAEISSVFQKVDLLAMPTTPTTALTLEAVADGTTGGLTRNTSPFNLAGVPAISVPCGSDADGLPIGLMLVGRWWDEAGVLRAAHAYQMATDWHRRQPPIKPAPSRSRHAGP